MTGAADWATIAPPLDPDEEAALRAIAAAIDATREAAGGFEHAIVLRRGASGIEPVFDWGMNEGSAHAVMRTARIRGILEPVGAAIQRCAPLLVDGRTVGRLRIAIARGLDGALTRTAYVHPAGTSALQLPDTLPLAEALVTFARLRKAGAYAWRNPTRRVVSWQAMARQPSRIRAVNYTSANANAADALRDIFSDIAAASVIAGDCSFRLIAWTPFESPMPADPIGGAIAALEAAADERPILRIARDLMRAAGQHA